MIIVIGYVICCLGLLGLGFHIYGLKLKLKEKVQQDNEILELYNAEVEKKQNEYNSIASQIEEAEDKLKNILICIEDKDNELHQVLELIPARTEQLNTIRESIALAQESCERELEIKKQEVNEEYKEHLEAIQENIANVISAYGKQCDALSETIKTYENYIAAYIEAQRKEAEKKDNIEFYKISLNNSELSDVKKLIDLSSTLNQPDILKKLIYKTYFEKKMNDLLGRVIGSDSEVSGVYKITHIDTGMAYIGQAVNLKERWRKHLKCGLGIDTPSTNAFYQAMMKYQPWNFTWEVIEYCPKEKLNEVEKHYIDFFQTKSWGWNSKGGNTK